MLVIMTFCADNTGSGVMNTVMVGSPLYFYVLMLILYSYLYLHIHAGYNIQHNINKHNLSLPHNLKK